MLKIKKFFYLLILMIILVGCDISNDVVNSSIFNSVNTADNTDNEDIVPSKRSIMEEKAINWYIRLQAEDTSTQIISSNAQLGVLDEEQATVKHTLITLPPMGSDYIDIVFQDPVGVDAGDYKTNFQQFSENSEYRWRFTVRTDNVNAQMALTWRGIYVLKPYIDTEDRQRYDETRSMSNPIIKNMQLIDVDTGNTINVLSGNQAKVYYFNMNGKTEKTFEWVVLPDSILTSSGSK